MLAFVFGSDKLFSQNTPSKSPHSITATYYPYVTALGKGKGIIFIVNIKSKTKHLTTIDSFFVNAKSLPFIVKNTPTGLSLESNYMKSKEEPSYTPGVAAKEPKEINDEILVKNKFYPSWIICTVDGKQFKWAIKKYFMLYTTEKL